MELKPLSSKTPPKKRLDDGFVYGFGFWLSFYVVSFVFIPAIACIILVILAALGKGVSG